MRFDIYRDYEMNLYWYLILNKPQKNIWGHDQRSFYTPGSEIFCEGGCNSSKSLTNEKNNLSLLADF